LEEVTGGGGERKAMMMVEPWVGAPLPCPTSPTAVEEVGGGGALGDRWRVGGKMAVASPRPQAVGSAGWTREIGGAQEESNGERSTIGNDDLFVSANIFIGTRN
jgi:hypothetical protein